MLLNSGDPDQTPHFVASDQCRHCLLISDKNEAMYWLTSIGIHFGCLPTAGLRVIPDFQAIVHVNNHHTPVAKISL